MSKSHQLSHYQSLQLAHFILYNKAIMRQEVELCLILLFAFDTNFFTICHISLKHGSLRANDKFIVDVDGILC